MKRIKQRIVVLSLTVLLTTFAIGASPRVASAAFNDEYVYATTRQVSEMDAPAGLKLAIYPVTIVLDTAFLPFAVIAGFVTA